MIFSAASRPRSTARATQIETSKRTSSGASSSSIEIGSVPGSAAAPAASTTIAMRRFFFMTRDDRTCRRASTQTAAGISKMMPITNIIVISNG